MKKKVRKLLLEKFHEEMAVASQKELSTTSPPAKSTTPSSASSSPSKPQFLVHRKQGKSYCFTKVFFKPNIDQKIVSNKYIWKQKKDSGSIVSHTITVVFIVVFILVFIRNSEREFRTHATRPRRKRGSKR